MTIDQSRIAIIRQKYNTDGNVTARSLSVSGFTSAYSTAIPIMPRVIALGSPPYTPFI